MKRMSANFYKELHTVRDKYGDAEYSRDEILPAIMTLISKYLADDDKALLKDAANSILDNVDRADSNASEGMFPHFAHVALGERKRIKRGAMNLAQLNRRKRIIDDNKTVQDTGWSQETAWLNKCTDALEGHVPETKISDVLKTTEIDEPLVRAVE